jgi:hypothetical protein
VAERGSASGSGLKLCNGFGQINIVDSITLLRVSDPRSIVYDML